MKKFILLLVFIFILVVGSIIGIYYFTNKDKTENTNKDNTTKIITYEVTDQKILDILQILEGPGCDMATETYLSDHTVYAKDIPSSIAAAVPWHRKDLENQDKVSLEQYTKYVQKYFGEDYQFEPKKGDSLLCMWEYNEAEKAFIAIPKPACGCGPNPEYTRYRIVKAVQNNENLEIDLRVAFYRTSGNCFYADYEATRSIPGMGINEDLEFYASDEAFAQADLYRMTFKENNGNYVFIKAGKVE